MAPVESPNAPNGSKPQTQTQTQTQPLPAFTRDEVAKHNTRKDAWITCNGFVLDVTTFLDSHPGGAEVIADCLGKDVRKEMLDTQHSPFAYTYMKEFAIGVVKGEAAQEMYPVAPKHMRGYTAAEIARCVDFSKPSLPQIAALGDKYWPWVVNRPVCHKMVIFPYTFFETCSHWPWWYIWALWPPAAVWGLGHAWIEGWSIAAILLSFCFGALLWTFLEYQLHRFVFHHPVFTNSGNVFHYFMHGIHHLTPADSTRLTFPPWFAVIIAWVAYNVIMRFTPSSVPAMGIFAGFTVGYLLYDTAHFFYHHSDFDNRIFRFLKSYHLGHHYKDEDHNFGVTCPLWDIVFGTYDPSNISQAGHKSD